MRQSALRRATRLVPAIVLASAAGSVFGQDVISQWNFNSSNAPSSFSPNILSAPSLSGLGGMVLGTASGSGSTDTVQPGSALQLQGWPAQSTNNNTAGFQANIDTRNFTLSTLKFDVRSSSSVSRYFAVQYTTNGSAWNDATLLTNNGSASFGAFNFDLTTLNDPSINNNANFGIRLVARFAAEAFNQGSLNVSGGSNAFAANSAYRAAGGTLAANGADNSAYTTNGSLRIDMLTLLGTYTPPVFNPQNLTWNSTSGTWDTNTSNKPWLNGSSIASSFAQSGGLGDNVTFNNPASGSVITIDAGGVTPNSVTINNSGTLTFTGGSIGGTGGLSKSGAGRLILASANAFTSSQSASAVTGGVVETRANNGLGSGTVSFSDATWNSTTAAQTANTLVNLTGAATFDTVTDLTISQGLAGTGTFTKVGGGTLGIGGLGTNTGSINILAGTVRLDNAGALGGNGATIAPLMIINNATLQFNASATSTTTYSRNSASVSLNNSTIERLQLTVAPAAATTNSDSQLVAYSTLSGGAYSGGVLTVTGNSIIRNNETRTALSTDTPGGTGNANNKFIVQMPTVVTTGSTLTLSAVNGTLSQVGGQPTGTIDKTAVILRGAPTDVNPNDSLTLQAGAKLQVAGAGVKQIGDAAMGKAIVGLGTSAQESTFAADNHTFMTELAAGVNPNSYFVVGGTGLGGLRVEAPMNANYGTATYNSTSGLFTNNPDTSGTTFGDVFTMFSTARLANIGGYTGAPTQTPDGVAITIGGTVTAAASDAAGATGLIASGPSAATPVKFGVDNTSTSGALIYQVDATSGSFNNFGGLVLRKSFGGSVTTKLMTDVTPTGAGVNTLDHLGGTLDTNGKTLTVNAVNAVAGLISGAGSVNASSLAKTTASTYTIGSAAKVAINNVTISGGGTLQVNGALRAASVTLTGTDRVDLGGSLITSETQTVVKNRIVAGRNAGAWNGAGGISSSAAAANNSATLTTGVGYATVGSTPLTQLNVSTFGGMGVTAGQVVARFTLLGDVNLDGQVTSVDFNAFSNAANYGLTSGANWINGDFDFDGKVNSKDFNYLAGNFGAVLPTVAPSPTLGSVVPEPATLSLLALGLPMLRRRR